jgi:hypothetical protein
LRENNRGVIALLVGFVIGVVVGFGVAWTAVSMTFGP